MNFCGLRATPVWMLCIGMIPASVMHAQAAAAASTVAPKALFISILEGEGELNDVRARTAREPIVQVEDENHKPVAGALVLFAIPRGSASAANFSGLNSLTVRTGADGRAIGHGFHVTRHTGKLEIDVTASVAAATAEVVIHQTNFAKGGRLSNYTSNHPTLTTVIVGLGAVAVAGTVIGVESQTGSTTITAGAGTVTGR
jgi:hypothetical protein